MSWWFSATAASAASTANCSNGWHDGSSASFENSKRHRFFTLASSGCRKDLFFWHVNCIPEFMARKLNPSKLRQNGVAQALPRRSSPPVAALYLMQLREQGIKISSSSRPARVAVEEDIEADAEQPVKITKVNKTR
jgi:hypothetical protein